MWTQGPSTSTLLRVPCALLTLQAGRPPQGWGTGAHSLLLLEGRPVLGPEEYTFFLSVALGIEPQGLHTEVYPQPFFIFYSETRSQYIIKLPGLGLNS